MHSVLKLVDDFVAVAIECLSSLEQCLLDLLHSLDLNDESLLFPLLLLDCSLLFVYQLNDLVNSSLLRLQFSLQSLPDFLDFFSLFLEKLRVSPRNT